MVPLEHKETLEILELMGHPDNQVHRDRRDLLELQDKTDHQAQLELLDNQELLVNLGPPEAGGYQETEVSQEQLANQAHLVHKEQLDR